jgi:hypothetical protein
MTVEILCLPLLKRISMIIHQHPGIDGTFSFRDLVAQAVKETLLVFLVYEDWGPVDSPHHDVVQSTRHV